MYLTKDEQAKTEAQKLSQKWRTIKEAINNAKDDPLKQASLMREHLALQREMKRFGEMYPDYFNV